MLGLDQESIGVLPRACLERLLGEVAHRRPARPVGGLGLIEQRPADPLEAVVGGKAQDILDAQALGRMQQLRGTESGIGAQDDLDAGPTRL